MDEQNNSHQSDVLVVGAGIAGLIAARHLHLQGIPVTVVDREERVGGRIVTEHIGDGWADIGAQFFTVREPFFQTYVDKWLAEELAYVWGTGWAEGSASDPTADTHPRYAATEGLNALCRLLAQDITVHKSVNITAVLQTETGWTAVADSGEEYNSQALILTPPTPISLALIDAGDVTLSTDDRAALEEISYAPCLCAVIVIDGETTLPEPGARLQPNDTVSWIADNQQKGISPEATTLTMHLNPDKSKLWWLAPDAELRGMMKQQLRPFLAPDCTIQEMHIHRWRYALPTSLHPERTLLAKELSPLAFAGDAFNGPRIEGAALSGLSAAKKIQKILA
jgi:predicted NAD/FAD-dependent oxidoreductase